MKPRVDYDAAPNAVKALIEAMQDNLIRLDKHVRTLLKVCGDDPATVRRELETKVPALRTDPLMLEVLKDMAERGECRALARVFGRN